MAVSNQLLGAARFSVGDALSDSFSELFRRFGFYMLLALTFAIPGVVMAILLPVDQMQPPETPEEFRTFFATIGFFIAVSTVFYVMLYASIAYAAVEGRRGRDVGLGEALRAAFGRGLYLAPTAILQMLAIMVGVLLLIVPGIIVLLFTFVAGPVAVMERAWPIRSFSRSSLLTKNHRWELLGLIVIVLLMLILIGALTSVITLLMVGFDAVQGLGPDPTSPQMLAATFINMLIQLPVSALSPIIGAVAYVALTEEKDGADPTRVTDVFQ